MAHLLQDGQVIGAYRVLRCIGAGGMGTVYEVEHVELGVHYALKTFTLDPADEYADVLKTKFLEEGKLLARLKHPNLTHVFDLAFDAASQTLYFVMDLITYEDGDSYTVEDVDPNDIDEDLAYKWFREMASALDYIHAEGIVHRDVKPGNLLVDKDLNVVLTDFGISRIFGDRVRAAVSASKTMVTKTGRGKLVMGTEKYMAPEVAAGAEVTPEADAYALGVMTLRWLTGFFYGDNPGALAMLSNKKYRWLNVLPKLLAPVGRRPKTYSDLARQLKPPAAERPVAKKAAARQKEERRSLARAALAAVFFAAFLGGAGWFGWQAWQKYEADRKADAAKLAEIQRQMRERENAQPRAVTNTVVKVVEREVKVKEQERPESAVQQESAEDEAEKVRRKVRDRRASVDGKLVFGEDDGTTVDERLGEIPNRQYKWFDGGEKDNPNRVTFYLANGAKFEFVPMKGGTFYMSNHRCSPKNSHKVTLTRPFWFGRTCLTVEQWREFGPNDYSECQDIEKVLGGKHSLVLALSRKSADDYCSYLTRKYRSQLPKGYVFRLPSEAEWEYALDHEANVRKYNKPRVKWWGEFVNVDGETARNAFKELRATLKLDSICNWHNAGWVKDRPYGIGMLAMPSARGICDLYGWDRLVLDVVDTNGRLDYADEETDPLRFSEGIYDERRTCQLTRDWEINRNFHWYGSQHRVHIVIGPDLIGEKAWKNKGTVCETKAKVPQQPRKFDAKKIRNKITKAQEIKLKRVGGGETVFCEIPKARFNMSNVDKQSKMNHRVDLTYPFWMSKFLVTAREWREYAPYDYYDGDSSAAVRNFGAKYPICVPATQPQWRAYCAFLNERYRSVLPPGYVFRLPTEAEWEWAFIADDNNNIRNMHWQSFANDSAEARHKMDAEYGQKRWPENTDYDSWGRIGRVFVGGRMNPTGFGVMDIVVHGGMDVMTLDNYDVAWRKNDRWRSRADAVASMEYMDKEENPLHSDGCRSSFVVIRNMGAGRNLVDMNHRAFAPIVIAPDLEAPLLAKEKLPYPAEDFGGRWLGDKARRAAQSSRHEGWRNTDERIKRMLSLESRVGMGAGTTTRGASTPSTRTLPGLCLSSTGAGRSPDW